MNPRGPETRAGIRRRPLGRRERKSASPAGFSGVRVRFRPLLEFMEDRTLLSSFLVNTPADSGTGSLRQAILDSNAATSGTSTIDFAIPGKGVHKIAPNSPLPAITNSVLIDGFSEPGYAGKPLIELSGSSAGTADGLTVTGSDVTIRGLIINHFSRGAGIHLTGTGATDNWVYGVFVGTNTTGTKSQPNYSGVAIDGGASDNLIGTNGDGVNDAAERNVLSGNLYAGVSIDGQGTDGNVVAGNFLGTDISGSVALNNGTQPLVDSQGNYFGGGVAIASGASGNRIGTDGASIDDVGERNVIAGSNNDAIDIWGTGTDGNIVAGNFIGTDVTGTRSLGVAGDGVFLAEGASFNWIGVNPIGGTAAGDLGNVISGNGAYGVQIDSSGTEDNVVAGNKIGTDVTGTLALGNAWSGVMIQEAANNTVGGSTAGAGNLISGNVQDGVAIRGIDAVGDVVQGNLIGTDVTGTQRLLGNGYSGVYVGDWGIAGDAASHATIGGTTAGAGNVISDNGNYGVWISGPGTSVVVVQGNLIGTDLTGTVGLANFLGGVQIDSGAFENTIGGTTAGAGNVISGNNDDGVVITGQGTDDNQVAGNDVGTDRTGTAIIPNDGPGIDVAARASNNTIGGSNASAGNLITDNSGPGVVIQGTGSVGNQITANSIFGNTGQAIDLGDDGVTYNALAPRQGPNNFQNFPIIVATALGQSEGWLGGSTPDTVFRLDFYASAAYGPGGSGAAQDYLGSTEVTTPTSARGEPSRPRTQDYLGSMDVTTDATGQVTFAVPFTAPAGLPIITATATDPHGNTSELSSPLSGGVQAGSAIIRLASGQESLAFAPASGDSIALQNSNAESYGPTWEMTLFVSAGTLSLSSTAGLVGSGDGTGSLVYTGTLSALNAAMDGMKYTPPPGFQGNVSLTVQAESDGTALLSGQVLITTGSFVVTTTADSGPGSLRQAILDSDDATGGTNTMDFDISGSGVQTIVSQSSLPAITNPLVIDGTTQPGYAGVPLIAIIGTRTGGAGLLNVGADVTVKGLSIGGTGFTSVASSTLFTLASVPLPRAPGGTVTYQIVMGAGADLVATAQGVGASTSLLLLDAQGQIVVQSDGLSAAQPIDVIDTYIGPGTYSLEVRDSSGGGSSFTLTTTLTPASPSLDQIPVGSQLSAIVAGDFNGDGHLDLAVANGNFSGPSTVSVLLGNGDGTFQPQVTYAVGSDPSSIVAGDFNGDGHLDLAVANSSSNDVSVLLGNGDGTFKPQVTYAVGTDPSSIVVGDFSGDRHLDLAVANEDPNGPGTVSVLLGNGNGTFQLQVTYAVGSVPISIAAGDFNGDGHLDLAVANASSNDVSVLLGNGNGTFKPQVAYAVGSDPLSIVAGNFGGKGPVDLAVGDYASDDVSVLVGNGNGTFQAAQKYLVAGAPISMVAGDFNGGGKLELAVQSVNGIQILAGNGDGTFQPAATVAAVVSPGLGSMVTGDFNGDDRIDLAVATNYDVSILLGNGDGSFQASGPVPDAFAAADFNGDGRVDLAVVDTGSDEVSILLGNGDGTFQPAVQYAVGSNPDGIVAGDFNGDGRADLAVVNDSGDTVSVLLGNGDGTFQPQVPYAVGSGPVAIVAGDFNGDGHLDLAVTNFRSADVSILLGKGDGTFRSQHTYAVGSDPGPIVAGDFNGDGHLDLAVVTVNLSSLNRDPTAAGAVSVLLGKGNGTFQPQVTYAVGSEPGAIVAGDFNGDGHLDLVVANERSIGPGTVSILLGNGDGTFQPQVTYTIGFEPGGMVADDFNGDGHLDLVIESPAISGFEILLGNGDGTFQPAQQDLVGSTLGALVTGDFNGDGLTDLGFVDESSDEPSILLSNGDGTFSDPGQFVTTPHATPVVADVNGDGTDDVLVIDGAGDILYRQGIPGRPGTFAPPITVNPPLPDGTNPFTSRDIAWVPYSLAGPLLASVDAQNANLTLYAYRDRTFVRVGSLSTGQLPAQVIAVDLSGTGWDDLVVRNAGSGTLSIYYGAGDKTVSGLEFSGPKDTGNQLFGFPVTVPVGVGVSDVQGVDTTADGRLDLVVTDKLTGQVSVLLNQGGGKFAAAVPYRAGTGLSTVDSGSSPEITDPDATAGVAAGPITPGGLTGLVTINSGTNTVDVLSGLGGGRFANPVTLPTQGPAQVVRMADFTGNGIEDLAVLTSDGVSIYMGNGNGGFASPMTYPVPKESSGLTIADVNHDGNPDLLVGDAFGDVLVLLGNGNGTFQPYHDANQSVELAVADLSGDGTKDIVYADQSLDRVVVDYGAGNLKVLPTTGLLNPRAVALADLNGDGIPDLIVANSGSNNVLIYPGLGNGQFGPAVNDGNGYFVGTNPVGITVATNLTGALPDLVVADDGSNDVAILLNQGNFSFTAGPRLSSGGTGPVSTLVGDFTAGSKLQDILVTNNGSDNVTLLQGVGDGFFKPAINTSFPVHKGPVVTFAGTFTGNTPGLVTVNAGSDDLTLTSNFESPDPVTTTISSGGLDPDAAFVFEDDGFDDLVVGNSGDGVLALFEGGEDGLTLMSTQVEPDLPSPTALAYSALTGGQIQFYAATAGHDQADLISLCLAAESSLSPALPGPSNPSPSLQSSEGSSLPLVAVVLTLTVEVSANELSLPLDEAGDGSAGAFLAGSGITVGQGLSSYGLGGGSGAPVVADELTTGGAAAAHAPALPWERFVLGLDQIFDRFMRENPNGLSGALNGSDRPGSAATPSTPAPGNPPAPPSAPAPPGQSGDHGGTQGSNAAETSNAVDSIIESLWKDDGSSAQSQQSAGWKRAPDSTIDGVPELRMVTSWENVPQVHDTPSESNVVRRVSMTLPLRGPGKDEPSLAAPVAFVVLANEWARWRQASHLRRSHMRKETELANT